MKRVLAVLLSIVCFGGVAACKSRGTASNDPQGLDVYLYNAGYGYEWAEALLDAFENEPWVKEKYPDLRVTFDMDEMSTRATELLGASAKINKFDLIMGQGMEKALTPDGKAADLTESVYASEVPGEGVLFKDKMLDSYVDAAAYNSLDPTAEDRYFQVNYVGGMGGMIYNEDLLTELGETVPNTTDELVAIMQRVETWNQTEKPAERERIEPYVTYGVSSYAQYLFNTWWAQYQTVEEYNNFFNGIDSKTNMRSPQIFKQEGLLRALEVLESYMYKDTGLTWVNSNTGREAYRETQNKVQLGTALFMANGDWVDNELRSLREQLMERDGHADTIKMMRTPVISSIIERLDSIPDDAALSAVVSAIDAGKSYETFKQENPSTPVTKEDYEGVYDARCVTYSVGPGHNAVIPDYAAGKEVAVDFLRFMATDKANEIFIEATNGASMPFKYNLQEKNPELYEKISPMQQGRLDYFASFETVVLPPMSSFPLVYYGSLSYMASGSIMTDFTSGLKKEDQYESLAEQLWTREYTYWTENNNARWNTCLTTTGL